MVIFHGKMLVHQRVIILNHHKNKMMAWVFHIPFNLCPFPTSRMKQQRRIHVRDENDLHSILQKDGSDVKQFGTGASDGAAAGWDL